MRIFIQKSDHAGFAYFNLLEIKQRIAQMSHGQSILLTFVQALSVLSAITNPLLYFTILRGRLKKLWRRI